MPKEGILPYKGVGTKSRGHMQGFVNTFRDFLIYFYAWQDSKPVHMISSIRSTWQDVTRNSRDAVGIYRRLVLKQPTIIWLYNQGMGGTDSFDQKLSMYRTNVKVLGWYRKVIFHMMQCSVVNAHILLREKFQLDRKEDNFTLLMFMRNLIREIFAGCCENNDKSEIDSGEDDEPLDDLSLFSQQPANIFLVRFLMNISRVKLSSFLSS